MEKIREISLVPWPSTLLSAHGLTFLAWPKFHSKTWRIGIGVPILAQKLFIENGNIQSTRLKFECLELDPKSNILLKEDTFFVCSNFSEDQDVFSLKIITFKVFDLKTFEMIYKFDIPSMKEHIMQLYGNIMHDSYFTFSFGTAQQEAKGFLFDSSDGRLKCTISPENNMEYRAVTVSNDGHYVFLVCNDKKSRELLFLIQDSSGSNFKIINSGLLLKGECQFLLYSSDDHVIIQRRDFEDPDLNSFRVDVFRFYSDISIRYLYTIKRICKTTPGFYNYQELPRVTVLSPNKLIIQHVGGLDILRLSSGQLLNQIDMLLSSPALIVQNYDGFFLLDDLNHLSKFAVSI